jgi:RNA-directed DNA polymerase
VTDGRTDPTPAPVPVEATQAGEVRARWAWTEPCVWTDRMLTALEAGVKGGVWFSLVDKVYAPRTLRRAFEDVKANEGAAGADHVTVAMFAQQLEPNLETLSRQLQDGTYRPQAVRRTYIEKDGGAGTRPLGIPTVRDRTVQTALRYVLEPIFERDFASQSYGFRPGRGCKGALRRVQALLDAGYTHVVDADLQSYFDSIPHGPLLVRVREKVADGRVMALLEGFLTQHILEGLRTWIPEGGTPQGAVISPLLANIYLDPLDHELAVAGYEMVRYADDLVLLCRTAAEADAALAHLTRWTTAAGLRLHPTKTRVVDTTAPGGFDFLGYHFERGLRWPRTKSLRKLKDRLRLKTRRTNGHSLPVIIANVNVTLQGWFAYFKHSHCTAFAPLDQWVRMRLRSILRKRQGRRGRGRGADHQRWPNAFFAAHGLFSLTTAHVSACQSVQR